MRIGRFAAVLSGMLLAAAACAKSETSPPAVVSQVQPAYPAEVGDTRLSGNVVIEFTVDEEGRVQDMRVVTSTHRAFEKAALAALREWRFEPGVRNGRPVKTKIRLPIAFNSEETGLEPIGMTKADATDVQETLPVPTRMVLPEYPAGMLEAGEGGRVDVIVFVTDEGKLAESDVISSTDDRLERPTLDAIRGWVFTPAMKGRKAINCICTIVVEFRDGTVTVESISRDFKFDVAAKPLKQVAVVYPKELQSSGNIGEVRIRFFVDRNGNVLMPWVIKSTHPAFEAPAVAALLQWKFSPATNGGKPVTSAMELPMRFSLGGSRGVEAFAMEKNRKANVPEVLKSDTPPKPKLTVFPVHPYDDAIAMKEGSAEVKMVIGKDGAVLRTEIMSASKPEFGLALAASIEAWTFEPALRDKKPVIALIGRKQKFGVGERDSALDSETMMLANRIRKRRFTPAKGGELDNKLKPMFAADPIYPTVFEEEGKTGTAKIEVIVDKKGRAVLPRIVEASEPEFGWAAATAAQRWIFEPPTVGGKPVEVKVVIPFRFTAPDPLADEQPAPD